MAEPQTGVREFPEVRSSGLPERAPQSRTVHWLAAAVYTLLLALSAAHFYQVPYWTMDLLSYMGNARLHETMDPVQLHNRVYGELRSSVPADVFGLLTGAPGFKDDHGAKHDRFVNPYHYTEFLPLFAIRPMYILTIYGMSRSGMGLVQAVRLISAVSYALLGILVFVWLSRYTRLAPLLALLIMWTPHITFLGRFTGCDGISVLLGMLSLFLIFEQNRPALGLGILMSAIWFRTDNIALVAPVVLILFLQDRIDFWKAAILGLVAVTSVLVIDHEAGHYGIRLLYYDTFVGIPVAPAEMNVQFPFKQYVYTFLNGYKQMLISFVPLFLILGLVGWTRRMAPLLGIATVYAALHYVILPDWVDRYMAVFYLITMMSAAIQVWPRPQESHRLPEQEYRPLGLLRRIQPRS
jgi:hypothetical protein